MGMKSKKNKIIRLPSKVNDHDRRELIEDVDAISRLFQRGYLSVAAMASARDLLTQRIDAVMPKHQTEEPSHVDQAC